MFVSVTADGAVLGGYVASSEEALLELIVALCVPVVAINWILWSRVAERCLLKILMWRNYTSIC